MEKFGEHMAPFAVQMTQQLAAAFMKYANADDEDEDDDVGEAGDEKKGSSGRIEMGFSNIKLPTLGSLSTSSTVIRVPKYYCGSYSDA